MLIAIVSDTHSRLATIQRTLDIIAERRADLIFHCGDLEDPDAVRLFPAHTHFVYGNCDHDRAGIQSAIHDIGAQIHTPFAHVEVAGLSFGFLHGDDKRLLRELENSDAFDFLFHGHTHTAAEHRTGRTRVINPGALHRASPKTFVLLDTATLKIESIVVE